MCARWLLSRIQLSLAKQEIAILPKMLSEWQHQIPMHSISINERISIVGGLPPHGIQRIQYNVKKINSFSERRRKPHKYL